MPHALSIPLVVAACGALFFLGHALEALFRRHRIPDVLPLIVVGYLVGPATGWIRPLGGTTIEHVFSHVALIIILFHGGLDLRLAAMKESALPALHVSLGGMGLNVLVVTALAHWTGAQTWQASILLGVALAPLAATVAIPLLEHLRLSPRTGAMLTLESALGDVVTVVGVLTLAGAFAGAGSGVGHAIGGFLSSLFAALVIGLAAALFWSLVLGRVQQLAKTSFATEALLLVVAGLTEWLGFSGAIGALAFGIGLRNLDHLLPPSLAKSLRLNPQGLTETENALLAEAVFILKLFFFVYLGTQIRLNDIRILGMGALVTLALVVIRQAFFHGQKALAPEAAERRLVAWLIPKGLATAVVASVPLEMGLPGGAWIRDVAYAVIPISILVTSLGVALLARKPAPEAQDPDDAPS
ncbi:MAG: cation:proton antiporter [Holophagaceae bacterium]